MNAQDTPVSSVKSASDIPSLPHVMESPAPVTDTQAQAAAPAPAPSEPEHTEHRNQYVFARLKRDMPLPTRSHMITMLATLYLVMFLAGWNDASQGPLLPSLQTKYNVDYLVISIIWICNCIGFVIAGVANVFLTDRLGFGIAAPIGSGSQALAYVLICWGPPFPLFLIAYIFNGFGLGLQDAQVNSLVTRVKNAERTMFFMHAMYGFGATISPLISTQFVKQFESRVTLYFAVSLGLAAITTTLLLVVFRLRTEDQIVGRRTESASSESTDLEKLEGEQTVVHIHIDSSSKFKTIMKTPAAHFMAFYLLIYVGVEVNLGGWITTFLLDGRGGNDNVGYVTTGYFAGLTVGRIILIPVTKFFGKYNSIYIYTILCIVLEIVIWTVPHLVSNAVLFCIIGILLGPMYPIVMMVIMDIIPPQLQSGTIGWVAALGQAGSAAMPFLTGGISNKYGVWVLQPIIVAFLGASMILWFLVPRPKHAGLRV